MAGSFAFIFSIGIYLTQRSEKISYSLIPLFNKKILLYFLLFTISIILPFITYITTFEDYVFKLLFILCFGLLTLCLSLIPLVFESIRKRYQPQEVYEFLTKKAINNIETSKDYYESWQYILHIDAICRSLFKEEEIDLFSRCMNRFFRILRKGVEMYEQGKEITFNEKDLPLNEWIRRIETRIIWIGEGVVENSLAFERVLINIISNRWLSNERPSDVFSMSYHLCSYADRKNQNESLEKGLYYLFLWCIQTNCTKEKMDFFKQFKNKDSVRNVVNILRIQNVNFDNFFRRMDLLEEEI